MGKTRKPKFSFAVGLQKAVFALRNAELLLEKQFLEMLSPIKVMNESGKGARSRNKRFLVQVRVKPNFSPDKLWLRFNRSGTHIAVSPDLKEWINISRFAKIITGWPFPPR